LIDKLRVRLSQERRKKMSRFVLSLLVIAALMCARVDAAQYNKIVNIGDKAPAFADLQGVDDKQYGLEQFKKAKAVALVFTCNHCPVAQAYEDRLIALQDEYGKRGVQIVAISVSKDESDSLEKMKERAESEKYNYPYLHDASQKSGEVYGAAVTPHVFLLDSERQIAYMGAIDDNQNPEKVTKHYLRDAIDAVLAGKSPETTETRQFGCGIHYEK
jgi:peroxiredoxin